MTDQDPIQVGIAGLGRSGWDIHARLLAPLAGRYNIAAALDADAARRQEAADRFGCRTYDSYPDLLADEAVELVIVAVPSHLHPEYAVVALQAGKDVVCEKPMAMSLRDADRMIAAAEQSGRILAVFQNRRYDPDFVKVREVIDSGLLGRIVLIHLSETSFSRRWDWQTLQTYGGGTLNNTGPHHLDMALQLFGEAEPRVFCHLERTLTLGDAEDHVKIILSGPGAPMIDIEISSACAFPLPTWHILGTQGGLQGSKHHLHWKYVDPATLPPRTVDTHPTPNRSYDRDDPQWMEGSWGIIADTGPGHTGFYLDLYETIRHGAPLAITPESARRVVWLQETCHRLSPL